MRALAPWLAPALLGLLLLTGVAPQAAADKPEDVKLELGPYFFNPSIAKHQGVYLATARTAHMKRIDRTNWWFNEGYICMSITPDFRSVSCRKFDPWQGRFQECLWGNERKVADVDTQGVEDPKLFVWPGKGIYSVFGRKPEADGSSPYCQDPIFVQFIVQVVAHNVSDEWSIHRPRELRSGVFAPQLYQGRKGGEPVKEKNWMPFVLGDQLHMVHSVNPHRVFRMSPNGTAVQQWVTRSSALLEPYKNEDIHGGPPLVYIGPELAGGAAPYFLGVMHFFQTFGEGVHKVKVYHHYAYKMEAAPPFRVCAVSKEITLVTRKSDASKPASWTHQRIWKDTSQTAYISGLYLDGAKVLLSYGSSDIDARLLSMPLQDLEALFPAPFDCSSAEVLDPGSGEQAPAGGSGGGDGGGGGAGGGGEGAPLKAQRMEYKHRHQSKHRRAHHRGTD